MQNNIDNNNNLKNEPRIAAPIIPAIITAGATLGSVVLSSEINDNRSAYPVSAVVENNLDVELELFSQGVPIRGGWKQFPPNSIAKQPSATYMILAWKNSGLAPTSVKSIEHPGELNPEQENSLAEWIVHGGVDKKPDARNFANVKGFGVKSTGNGSSAVAVYRFSRNFCGQDRFYKLAFAIKNRWVSSKQRCAFAIWVENDSNRLEICTTGDQNKDGKYEKLSNLITGESEEHLTGDYDQMYAFGYTKQSKYSAGIHGINIKVQGKDKACTYTVTSS